MPKFSFLVFILFIIIIPLCYCKTNNKNKAVLEDIVDLKDFKKLLRTKTNVLVFFASSTKAATNELRIFRDVAEAIRGTGTMLLIDCSHNDKKKLCKKLKVSPDAFILKHYKDGEFHKDYDRQLTVASMVNFMRDPNGELPWEEDPTGKDVIHFNDYPSFVRHLKKDLRPMLAMFYVTWCGYCKRLKPDYSKAASELKEYKNNGYVLAAMNVEKQENALARKQYNITGFPTIIYFEKGLFKQIYEGDNSKNAIISFMLDPKAAPVKRAKEPDWSSDPESEIVHLTTQGFKPAITDENSVLIIFYATWCPMKREFEKAALEMREKNIPGLLAALDATKEPAIAAKYKVKGYPTIKYFVNGVYKFDVNLRDANKIIDFMRDPQEPAAPPPLESPWEEEENSEVLFLNDENFSTILKRKKHALVIFYATSCGIKNEFTAAAQILKDDPQKVFAAVDCTRETNVCSAHKVRNYPTIKYFSYLKTKVDYDGGRKSRDFIAYLNNQEAIQQQRKEEL